MFSILSTFAISIIHGSTKEFPNQLFGIILLLLHKKCSKKTLSLFHVLTIGEF